MLEPLIFVYLDSSLRHLELIEQPSMIYLDVLLQKPLFHKYCGITRPSSENKVPHIDRPPYNCPPLTLLGINLLPTQRCKLLRQKSKTSHSISDALSMGRGETDDCLANGFCKVFADTGVQNSTATYWRDTCCGSNWPEAGCLTVCAVCCIDLFYLFCSA